MARKKKTYRKKWHWKRTLLFLTLFFCLLHFVLPAQSALSQVNPVSIVIKQVQSQLTKARIEAEHGANALNGITVVGTGENSGNGQNKGQTTEASVTSNEGTSLSSESQATDANVTDPSAQSYSTEWSMELAPNYYQVIGTSHLDTSLFGEAGTISYSELDPLGRTGVARGALTYQNVANSYGTRQEFASDTNPSGWGNNAKASITWLNDKVYNGYFWNRSHLIADSLGGDAIRANLITGTRPQNVGGTDQQGGMRYSEKKVQAYLESNQDVVVYYQVEPVYQEYELVPRYVMVDFLSSDGALNEQVIVFNTANGYNINYQTGSFTAEN